jgi:PAS domain S-box-containing protein
MGKVSVAEGEHAGNAVSALTEYSELLFDRAPVMMHSVNKRGKLVKVNRLWTERLGHKRKEVVGQSPTEFLTDESRSRAIQDVLPLFWRNGSDRSVGMRFVKRDGRTLDVQLDAEVVTTPGKTVLGYAALRDPDDRDQWEQASATIKALKQLTNLQRKYESILSVTKSQTHNLQAIEAQTFSGQLVESGLVEEVLGAAIEIGQDISASLRVMPRVQEEWLSQMVELKQEMLRVAKSIDRSLADIADSIATAP